MKNIYFKTRELTFFEKLLQVYWTNPKSWLLDEFKLEGDILTIIRKDEFSFTTKLQEVEATYLVDKFDRREITVKDKDGRKTRFKEIPWMLEDEEWNTIVAILKAEESEASKILRATRKTIDKIRKDK